jgi:choline dehydrogenase
MLLSDQSYRAQQLALYYSKRQGPFTIAKDGGNVVAFLSLPTVTPSYRAIVEMAKSQSPASVYPSSTDPTVLAGYRKQRLIIIRLLNSTTAPVQETGWNTNSVIPITLLKPLSRGSIAVQSRDIFTQPLIDFRALSDPTDLEMLVAIVEINRKMIATAPMQGLGPVETVPGANLTSKEQLRTAVRQHLNPTYVHPCCTAAMMKKELGGVIDKNLLVYGLEGLSVVDASVFPMIPGTHPSATIYALAEKVRTFIPGNATGPMY